MGQAGDRYICAIVNLWSLRRNRVMLWIVSIALSIACVVLGVISLRRGRRAWGIGLIALGLLIFVAPLPTLSIKVELPPAAKH